MYYILFYETGEHYLQRRAPFRERHLAYAREFEQRGELVMAGALADPPDQAVLVFKGDGPEVAERFAKGDPYVVQGVIAAWKVRPWTVVIGG
jgi:uncharacterized protein